jgi:L-lactate dehydrogenase complex protein LldE
MPKVGVFIPCLVDQFLPEVGAAVMKIMSRLGIEHEYCAGQTCCGQPLVNAGSFRAAAGAARRNIALLEKYDHIVAPSGSCIYTMREHYPRLLDDDFDWRQRALALAARVFEFSEYLVSVRAIRDTGAGFAAKGCLHECCSIKNKLGVSEQPKVLLGSVKGLVLATLPDADTCCGFGGSFSNDYPDISAAMLADKTDRFLLSGADTLILGEPGCLLNIRGYFLRRGVKGRVVHIAQVLAGDGEAGA